MESARWRVLDKAHQKRNVAEYQGYLEEDEQLLRDMLAVTAELIDSLPEENAS